MGSVTYYVNGLPVTIRDRTYSLDETLNPVSPAAFKTNGAGDTPLALWRTQPALRTVVSFIADAIAQIPIHVFKRDEQDGRERVRSGDLAGILKQPNGLVVTPYEFIWVLVVDWLLYDRYYARLVTTGDGRRSLVRVPPTKWSFKRDSFDAPEAITPVNGEKSVSLDSGLWLDGYPTADETSPIESIKRILADAAQDAEYRRLLAENAGVFPGTIERPAGIPWTRDASNRFRNDWKGFRVAGPRAGTTPVLEDGMKYVPIPAGITPEAGQQLEFRKLTTAEVAAAYHLPGVMVGLDSGSSYNAVEGYRDMLYSDVLGTVFARLDSAFNLRLVPLLESDPTVYTEFHVGARLRLSLKEQAVINQTQVGRPIKTAAEARRELNLPYIEGTDELVTPLNVLIGGQSSPTDSGSQNVR